MAVLWVTWVVNRLDLMHWLYGPQGIGAPASS